MIGLPKGTVKLVAHSAGWRELFEAEKTLLRSVIGKLALEVEHIGSTSVCGLEAKPIIDMAVAVREILEAAECVAPLEGVGYVYRGENGIPGRHYFRKGDPTLYHLHMVELSSEFWRAHLLFRDYLRGHQEVAAEYGKLKRELAMRYPFNREAYTEGKAAFIEGVLKRAEEFV